MSTQVSHRHKVNYNYNNNCLENNNNNDNNILLQYQLNSSPFKNKQNAKSYTTTTNHTRDTKSVNTSIDFSTRKKDVLKKQSKQTLDKMLQNNNIPYEDEINMRNNLVKDIMPQVMIPQIQSPQQDNNQHNYYSQQQEQSQSPNQIQLQQNMNINDNNSAQSYITKKKYNDQTTTNNNILFQTPPRRKQQQQQFNTRNNYDYNLDTTLPYINNSSNNIDNNNSNMINNSFKSQSKQQLQTTHKKYSPQSQQQFIQQQQQQQQPILQNQQDQQNQQQRTHSQKTNTKKDETMSMMMMTPYIYGNSNPFKNTFNGATLTGGFRYQPILQQQQQNGLQSTVKKIHKKKNLSQYNNNNQSYNNNNHYPHPSGVSQYESDHDDSNLNNNNSNYNYNTHNININKIDQNDDIIRQNILENIQQPQKLTPIINKRFQTTNNNGQKRKARNSASLYEHNNNSHREAFTDSELNDNNNNSSYKRNIGYNLLANTTNTPYQIRKYNNSQQQSILLSNSQINNEFNLSPTQNNYNHYQINHAVGNDNNIGNGNNDNNMKINEIGSNNNKDEKGYLTQYWNTTTNKEQQNLYEDNNKRIQTSSHSSFLPETNIDKTQLPKSSHSNNNYSIILDQTRLTPMQQQKEQEQDKHESQNNRLEDINNLKNINILLSKENEDSEKPLSSVPSKPTYSCNINDIELQQNNNNNLRRMPDINQSNYKRNSKLYSQSSASKQNQQIQQNQQQQLQKREERSHSYRLQHLNQKESQLINMANRENEFGTKLQIKKTSVGNSNEVMSSLLPHQNIIINSRLNDLKRQIQVKDISRININIDLIHDKDKSNNNNNSIADKSSVNDNKKKGINNNISYKQNGVQNQKKSGLNGLDNGIYLYNNDYEFEDDNNNNTANSKNNSVHQTQQSCKSHETNYLNNNNNSNQSDHQHVGIQNQTQITFIKQDNNHISDYNNMDNNVKANHEINNVKNTNNNFQKENENIMNNPSDVSTNISSVNASIVNERKKIQEQPYSRQRIIGISPSSKENNNNLSNNAIQNQNNNNIVENNSDIIKNESLFQQNDSMLSKNDSQIYNNSNNNNNNNNNSSKIKLGKGCIRFSVLGGGETIEAEDFSLLRVVGVDNNGQTINKVRINIKNVLEIEHIIEQICSNLHKQSYQEYIHSAQLFISTIHEDPLYNINQVHRFFGDEKLCRVGKALTVLEMISVYLIIKIGKVKKSSIRQYYTKMKSLLTYVHQSFLLFWDQIYLLLSQNISNKDCLEVLRERIEEKRQVKLGNKKSSYLQLKQNYDIISNIIKPMIKDIKEITADISKLFKVFEDQSIIETFNQMKVIFADDIHEIEEKKEEENEKINNVIEKQIQITHKRVRNIQPYLPPPNTNTKPYTLVLDLDETLIHFYETRNGGQYQKRPFCDKFLREMNKLYELVIFTAGTEDYANWVLDQLDKQRYITYRLYRQHTNFTNSVYVKDLGKIGRDLSKTLILDNVPENFRLQRENGIGIKSWYNDRNDSALNDLIPALTELANSNTDDVRITLKKLRQKYPPHKVRGNFDLPY